MNETASELKKQSESINANLEQLKTAAKALQDSLEAAYGVFSGKEGGIYMLNDYARINSAINELAKKVNADMAKRVSGAEAKEAK